MRKVYRKGDAVRKFTVAERSADDETIPFVIYFTDFSPTRKDPLKVTTQYALSKKRPGSSGRCFDREEREKRVGGSDLEETKEKRGFFRRFALVSFSSSL